MNVSKPLHNFSNLEHSSIVRFVEILSQVDQRVSSKKVASSCNYDSVGSIDKLVLMFDVEFDRSLIVNRAKKLNYQVEAKYLKDKKFYLFAKGSQGQSFQAHLVHRNNETFSTVTVNPSKFNSFCKLNDFLFYFFGQHLDKSLIKRIDFTVDLFDEFSTVIQGLDLTLKSAKTEYTDNKSFTGLRVGKGKDTITIYNKQVESKSNFPWTRVERKLSSSKTPIHRYSHLKDYLKQLGESNPLDCVDLNHIEFCRPVAKLTQVQEERFSDLKSLVRHSGLYQARKKLNENRTFKRDYSKYFLLIPHKKQASEILRDSMIEFIKEK